MMASWYANNVYATNNTTKQWSRYDMIKWINELLNSHLSKIEELCTGAAYCSLTDLLFPDVVNMHKVKFMSNQEYEYIDNFRVLQQSFNVLRVLTPIPIEQLVKGRFQDNFEFSLWFRHFFEANFSTRRPDYDPLAARGQLNIGVGPAAMMSRSKAPGKKKMAIASPEQVLRSQAELLQSPILSTKIELKRMEKMQVESEPEPDLEVEPVKELRKEAKASPRLQADYSPVLADCPLVQSDEDTEVLRKPRSPLEFKLIPTPESETPLKKEIIRKGCAMASPRKLVPQQNAMPMNESKVRQLIQVNPAETPAQPFGRLKQVEEQSPPAKLWKNLSGVTHMAIKRSMVRLSYTLPTKQPKNLKRAKPALERGCKAATKTLPKTKQHQETVKQTQPALKSRVPIPMRLLKQAQIAKEDRVFSMPSKQLSMGRRRRMGRRLSSELKQLMNRVSQPAAPFIGCQPRTMSIDCRSHCHQHPGAVCKFPDSDSISSLSLSDYDDGPEVIAEEFAKRKSCQLQIYDDDDSELVSTAACTDFEPDLCLSTHDDDKEEIMEQQRLVILRIERDVYFTKLLLLESATISKPVLELAFIEKILYEKEDGFFAIPKDVRGDSFDCDANIT